MEKRLSSSDASRLDQVTEQLDRRHLDMLNAESVEERQEILRQLRGHITEFLYLAPPHLKFKFQETATVLSQSVPEFDPRDAKEAFEDLAKYAHNLLEQPWRREFHKICLVSGFFLHNIRAHLRNVQDLLILLGYVSTDDHTMELHHIDHEENLQTFSRDCYVASHECLILSQIWERVQRELPNNPMTLLEAWNTRKSYTGNVDSACSLLLAQGRQRIYKIEEEEREKQKECERLILARAELAPPPPQVPVDNTLVDLSDDGELVRRVLENTEKETTRKLPESIKSGGHLNSKAAQFHPSPPAINGYVSSHFPSSGTYDLTDGRRRENTVELEEMIMQRFLNGHLPSGYRPRTHKIQQQEPYYSTVEGASGKESKERFAFQPLLEQAREMNAMKSENVAAQLQLTNGTEVKTEEYSMLYDAQEMLGRASKPIDCDPREEFVEPMDTSSPASYQRQEKESSVNIPAPSTAFKSLSRKQDLPKSTESEKKTGETLLSKLQLISKIPKAKEDSRLKNANASTNSSGQIVLGDFPLDRTKIPNPDSPNSGKKALGDIDEVDEMLRRLELEEEGANNTVFDATISNSGQQELQQDWDCKFCTYKNEAPHKVCTICAKSKDLCPENLSPPASPPKKSSESVWKTVTGKKRSSKTGSGGSKTPNKSDWPALDASTSTVYDTVGRRVESRSGHFSNKAKSQQTTISDSDPDNKLSCPQCTYLNEPLRASCEMCGAKF